MPIVRGGPGYRFFGLEAPTILEKVKELKKTPIDLENYYMFLCYICPFSQYFFYIKSSQVESRGPALADLPQRWNPQWIALAFSWLNGLLSTGEQEKIVLYKKTQKEVNTEEGKIMWAHMLNLTTVAPPTFEVWKPVALEVYSVFGTQSELVLGTQHLDPILKSGSDYRPI